MNAWIDCVTDLVEERADAEGLLVLRLRDAADFAALRPELLSALIDAVSFVNGRFDGQPRVALAPV